MFGKNKKIKELEDSIKAFNRDFELYMDYDGTEKWRDKTKLLTPSIQAKNKVKTATEANTKHIEIIINGDCKLNKKIAKDSIIAVNGNVVKGPSGKHI